MLQTYEATIDAEGNIRLLEPVHLTAGHRVLVTVLTEATPDTLALELALDTALLSEQSLAEDWMRPEEDDAWAHLQEA